MPYLSIFDFLHQATPPLWIEQASQNLATILVDHAHCEKKAAANALHLIHCYPQHTKLVQKLTRLAREELLHLEQVGALLNERQIIFTPLSPSRYAKALKTLVPSSEPYRLISLLMIGAIIEARSCERFHALAPYIADPSIKKFYEQLYKAEERHYHDYLQLAESYDEHYVAEKLPCFLAYEAELISSADEKLRFHSGPVQSLNQE